MSKTYHSYFDIKWLLRRPHGELGRMIKGEGKPLSAEKAFDFLLDKWRDGWHVLDGRTHTALPWGKP